jgi:chloramphenicol-sensitive protein RarD
MNKALWSALLSFILWGVFPLFWKQLDHISASEILLHRMAWAFVFLLLLQFVRGQLGWVRKVVKQRKILLAYAATSVLLSANWFIFIWAVNNERIVEASLGYFINPLINVLLGLFLLGEKMNRLQTIAVVLAAIGVAIFTWDYGKVPYISFMLAFSFGFYSLLRKQSTMNAIQGLSLETSFLLPAAIIGMVYLGLQNSAAFLQGDWQSDALLMLGGVVTALPLLLFVYGAQRIPLSTVGILQYLAPTLQFLIGVLVYHEDFSNIRLFGFMFIWAGLIIFTLQLLQPTKQYST